MGSLLLPHRVRAMPAAEVLQEVLGFDLLPERDLLHEVGALVPDEDLLL